MLCSCFFLGDGDRLLLAFTGQGYSAETRGQQARAVYDFNATNADEVGFQEGDIITVVRYGRQYVLQLCLIRAAISLFPICVRFHVQILFFCFDIRTVMVVFASGEMRYNYGSSHAKVFALLLCFSSWFSVVFDRRAVMVVSARSTDVGQDGWWLGDVDGQQGLIPSNYVELIEHEEPPINVPVLMQPLRM
jgi:hypothetical protein